MARALARIQRLAPHTHAKRHPVSCLPLLAWLVLPLLLAQATHAEDLKIPDGVKYTTDVQYGTGGDEKLHLDIATPAKAGEKLPCIVIIHGGAWRAGNKSGHRTHILQFAEKGWVAATVQYRLCPKHPFPAQIEDVKCAVRFLRAKHEEYGIDPRRMGALGFSAGAHLSMLLGVMGSGDGLEGQGGWPDRSSQVQAVVSYFGPTALGADDLPIVSQSLVRDFLGGTSEEKPDAYRRASPITYVTAGDAPVLIFQGTKDPLVPHTQAYKMADAMTKSGVPGRVELLLGAKHGWGGRRLNHTAERTFTFFDYHLRQKK